MKVILSTAALDDLENIFDYIAETSPAVARRISKHLREKAASLATAPERGAGYTLPSGRKIRRIVEQPFVIFYDLSEHAVLILSILHGARDVDVIMARASGIKEDY